MYVDHFRLSGRAFANAPDTDFFLPNAQVETAIARLCEVMLARDSIAIISGGPGVGKSAFVAAAHAAVADKAVVVNADLRYGDPSMLNDMLLLGLGAQGGDDNDAESLHRLKVLIREHNKQGKRVTAVIDLSGMTVERAKRILRLVHLAGEPGGQLNLVLTGPHALHRLLNAPGLIHMRQRVCFQHRIRPLTVNEVHAYIEEQFERAGGEVESILDTGAAQAVFVFVGGVPRLVNTLMDSTLSAAAIQHVDRIGPELINQVARELGWKPLAAGQARASVAAAAPRAAPAAPKPQPQPAQSTPRPPELSRAQEVPASTGAGGTPPPEPAPMSEAAAISLLDPQFATDDDEATQPARQISEATGKLGDSPTAFPEMSATDTSATGMLRLEDLDARFAETVFGEDATKSVTNSLGASRPQLPEEATS